MVIEPLLQEEDAENEAKMWKEILHMSYIMHQPNFCIPVVFHVLFYPDIIKSEIN